MKIRISNLMYITILFFVMHSGIFCQETAGESVTKKSNTVEQADVIALFQQSETKIKAIQTSISEIKSKMEEAGQIIKEVRTEIKLLQEKTSEADNLLNKELNKYYEQVQLVDSNLAQQSKKVAKLEEDFKEIKDVLKLRMDKMQSWDDIMDVLKKEISNNDIEIARLKKEIGELKRQYGYSDNIINSIARWPYTGITALAVSIIAFIAVLVKQ